MKSFQKTGIAAAIAIMLGSAIASEAQIIVRVRPVAPRRTVVVRPVAPSPRHVWVEDDWRVNNGAYVYNGGRYIEAPYERARWIPGHWKNTPRRGWVWKEGHWSR